MNIDYRNQFLDLVANDQLDGYYAILMLLKYMSQDDVRGCMEVNEILNNEEI